MRHDIIGKHQRWNMQRPTALLFLWERLQKSEQCMIKPFTDGISMQVVRHGCRLLDVIHGVQLGNYGILKTSALVAVNMGQDAIHVEPFFPLIPWQW